MNNLQVNEYASYQMNYIKLVSEYSILKGLVIQKEEMIHFFKTIPVFKQEYKYAESKWTIKDLILHLIDAERIFSYRALRIARNDQTALPGFEENDYVPVSDANERSVESLIKEYKLQRKSTMSLFKNLPQKSLENTGIASNNAISVRALGYIVAGHEKHHTNILKERYL